MTDTATDDRAARCAGKTAYISWDAADAKRRRKSRRGKFKRAGGHTHLEIYRCPLCRAWHLGGSA